MEKTCPICKHEFDNEEELAEHIINNKDENYILLKYFKNKHKYQTYEQAFIENKNDIMEYDELEIQNEDKKEKKSKKEKVYKIISC